MRGWMRISRDIAVVAGGLLAFLPTAFAAAGTTTTVVSPLTSTVTYSRVTPPLETYIGYTITVTNATLNTINHVRFEARPNSAASFTANGVSCDPAGGVVLADGLVSCPIGQLGTGAQVTFTLVFVAPSKESGITSFVLSGRTVYGEGTNPVADKTETWSPSTVNLVDQLETQVRTIIPTGGGEFSTFGDQFTTKIDVPASLKVTVATINEEQLPIGDCHNFRTCFASDIKIVDTAGNTALFTPYLTIVLHMDAANIKKGTRIESVTLQYSNGASTVTVQQCASPTTPQGGGVPCIAKSTHYKNKKTPGWTPALDGDFLWEVINTNNGRFTLF